MEKVAEHHRQHMFQEIHIDSSPESDLQPQWDALPDVSPSAFGFSSSSETEVCIKLVDHEFPSEHCHVGVYLQDGSKLLTP